MQYAKPVTLNVEECDRLFFLPYLFGQDFLYVEASVCALAEGIRKFAIDQEKLEKMIGDLL